MSCTQRQRSSRAERDEAHVGGCRAVGWSGVMGITCGSGRNVIVAVVQLPWTSCHVCWHMHCIPLTARNSSGENLFQRYHYSDKILEISLVFTHGITPARVNQNKCFVKKCILMFPAMHGHLASYRRSPDGHLAAGCATDPNSIFFQTLRCTRCRATLQNVKKNRPNFLKPIIFKQATPVPHLIKTARGIYFEWSMIYFYWYMYIKTRVFIFQAREQVLFYYFGSIATHGPAHW